MFARCSYFVNDIDRIDVVDAYFRGHDNDIVSCDVVARGSQSVPVGVRQRAI